MWWFRNHSSGQQPSFHFWGHWSHIWSPQYLLGTPHPLPPCSPWGKTERVNEIIKQHLTNLPIEVRLSWPSLLPIVLIHPWATPYSTTDLSPFVLLYRRLFLLNYHFPAQSPPVVSQVCHTIFPSYIPISIDRLTTVSLLLWLWTKLLPSSLHSFWGTGSSSSSDLLGLLSFGGQNPTLFSSSSLQMLG